MRSKTQSNGRIVKFKYKTKNNSKLTKMANFDPDSMGSRYIYHVEDREETSPTGLVSRRMDAGIGAGDEKSDSAYFVFSGSGGFSGVSRRPALGAARCWRALPVTPAAGRRRRGSLRLRRRSAEKKKKKKKKKERRRREKGNQGERG
ncbi:hypothetical protein TorRG33x02_208710, partial [Trema orientale]